MTNDLASLPNLGPKSRAALAEAGIDSLDALRHIGAVGAYVAVKARAKSLSPSLNLLWALEGVLTRRPWQVVAREDRLSLLAALEAAENKAP